MEVDSTHTQPKTPTKVRIAQQKFITAWVSGPVLSVRAGASVWSLVGAFQEFPSGPKKPELNARLGRLKDLL